MRLQRAGSGGPPPDSGGTTLTVLVAQYFRRLNRMAATQIPVLINGNISISGGPAQPCVVSGVATSSGPNHIWGGPIDPYPDIGFPGPQPRPPYHIWGGPFDPPRILGGPDFLPVPPPPVGGGGGGGEGNQNWSWAYSPVYGWVLVPPGGGGKPQPTPPGSGTPPEGGTPPTA